MTRVCLVSLRESQAELNSDRKRDKVEEGKSSLFSKFPETRKQALHPHVPRFQILTHHLPLSSATSIDAPPSLVLRLSQLNKIITATISSRRAL
jgi:hypothetical protein